MSSSRKSRAKTERRLIPRRGQSPANQDYSYDVIKLVIDGTPIHAFMNASKTVMVIFEDDPAGTTQQMTVAVKQE